MSSMLNALTAPGRAPFVILAASLAALAAAFVAQYLFQLVPCQLCIYQRWPYAVAAALAVLALAPGRARVLVPWLIGIAGIAFAVNAGVAVYHVGVEQQWWQGAASCVGTIDPTSSLEDLKAQILAAPVVRCDVVQWSFLGLSLAGWNVIASALLAIFSAAAATRCIRDAKPA